MIFRRTHIFEKEVQHAKLVLHNIRDIGQNTRCRKGIDVSQVEWKSIFGKDDLYESRYISEDDLNTLLSDIPGSNIEQKLKEVNARLSKKEIYLSIHKIDFMPFAEAAA